LNFPSTFKKKYSYIKFHEDIYFGSRTVPRGQMDRHAKANGHLPQF